MFKDHEAVDMILDSDNPSEIKRLGDTVKGFKKDLWESNCRNIMKKGLKEKFNQDENLKRYLLETKDKHLVEAAPRDKYWGCGLPLDNPGCLIQSEHTGKNILGVLLMEVREEMLVAVGNSPSRPPVSKKCRVKSPP